MARFGLYLAAAVTILSAGVDVVQAGSHLWQSGVKLQDPLPIRPLALNSRGKADVEANRNGTHGDLVKRYLIQEHQNLVRKWPDSTISYCYHDEEAKTAIQQHFTLAQRRWSDAHLDATVFRYNEVATPGPACANHVNRANILVIHYNNQGKLSTTNAIHPIDEARPNYVGPVMHLSLLETIGALNRVTNIAHEIGHAWGLMHEHQDRTWWEKPLGDSTTELGAPFKAAYFHCKNLNDYAAALARGLAAGHTKEKICSDQSTAASIGFSAADWLPFEPETTEGESLDDDDNVDWDSMMLYPSKAGGVGQGTPDNDGRATILQGWREPAESEDQDDRELLDFGGNLVPSRRDIKGLEYMYGEDSGWDEQSGLIIDPAHALNVQFNDATLESHCR